MCEMASGFINSRTFEVRVADLNSHSDTARLLGLEDGTKPDGWREMHYTPRGEIVCRVLDIDSHTAEECADAVREKWPTFVDFFNWAAKRLPEGIEWLYLNSLTSAEGLVLPEGIEWLDLSSLTSAEGLVLPEGIKTLDLNSLTSAEGLVLPEGIETLDLNSLTSAEKAAIRKRWPGLHVF